MKDLVRCRAEHAYPGRPLEVWHDERWQTVTEILEARQTPTGRSYQVICEGQNVFWLTYDPESDTWQVHASGGAGVIQHQGE
jgi:hypothetical protein